MLRRFLSVTTLCAGTVAATSAFAYTDTYNDTATVTRANPVMQTVQVDQPSEQCWNEYVSGRASASNSYTPEILGAILGGATGYQFGRGKGRNVGAVAGAVLGGSVGHDLDHRYAANQATGRTVQRCRTVHGYRTEQQPAGYDVTYRYNGRSYTTHTGYRPGRTIPVTVSVTPAY